jgi:uncharacterized membrane protein
MLNSQEAKRQSFFKFDAQYRLIISLIVGIIVFFFTKNLYTTRELILVVWIGFSLTLILMNWIIILASHPSEVKKIANSQDSSRTLLFLFVIVASLVSLVAILFLLRSSKGNHSIIFSHVLLAMGAVIVSWWQVQTIFSLRYAHLYYNIDSGNSTEKEARGLIFPYEREPDYLDFVYFGFVIGMTFQVSDVNVSSRKIRRTAWIHGLISFAFNTAIVALSINVISGLISA